MAFLCPALQSDLPCGVFETMCIVVRVGDSEVELSYVAGWVLKSGILLPLGLLCLSFFLSFFLAVLLAAFLMGQKTQHVYGPEGMIQQRGKSG